MSDTVTSAVGGDSKRRSRGTKRRSAEAVQTDEGNAADATAPAQPPADATTTTTTKSDKPAHGSIISLHAQQRVDSVGPRLFLNNCFNRRTSDA